jgi:predicted glutamine amidotransferase
MCRLFGLSGGEERIRATFWLLEAPDSLALQSCREPDGAGLGTFDADDRPRVMREPIAAYKDASFSRAAREERSRTFVAHVRYASTGEVNLHNTHPFEQSGRLFAHNGVVGDLEKYFALITKEIEAAGGDVRAGIGAAARWISRELPVFSLNMVLTMPDGLWALRYPETHDLFVLERAAGGALGSRHLDHASAAGTVRVRSRDLTTRPSVVVATERMDEDPLWRAIESGALLHVGPDLACTTTQAIDFPPAMPLSLDDLGERAASSQA